MKVRICLVALCCLVFYCSTAYGQTAEWEYKQFTNNISDELLNHYAKNGWEIAAAAGGGGDSSWFKVILKRSRSHPLFGTKTPEMPPSQPPPPPKSTCKLTLAQAPVIRGLRLGMTSDELFAIFPANEREEFNRAQQLKSADPAPNYGYTNFQFNLSNYATRDRFTGISSFGIGLLDGKVVSINADYRDTPLFDSPGQLMEVITRQFGLPEFKDWPNYYEYLSSPSISCEGFKFQAHVGGRSSFSIALSEPTYTKIVEDRRKADLARKREGFKL
jgi:hypothetical protein